MNRFASLLFLLLISVNTFAGKLTGKITDENNNPLPFAIVYVAGTSIGTTANVDGIYSLELRDSSYEVSFRIIGYKLESRKVTISSSPLEINVKLTPESVSLREVTIVAGEDPAYAIIRKA